MPFDVLGRTRATLARAASGVGRVGALFTERASDPLGREARALLRNARRDRDRPLELLVSNEESLVSAGQQPALTTSLPFVHTARRTYRLSDSVKALDFANGDICEGSCLNLAT
jgi:hypothetical protein